MNPDALSGETIAHFRIEHRLGAGGMGVVYRAEDVLLRRAVALKVLREEQMSDERRRARFLREARTAASLVHPNVATVYEVGEAKGAIFIAMELVDGSSLREILQRGPIDLPRATKWAVEIARALAKAHDAGIVHRDLKPDNVMITRDGDVKLLDFGIAKALVEESGSGDPALDSTALQAMTGEGTLVGTPEYMSPEQARGGRIDVRSDLFSFGALLYEMLAGASPFRRANVVETAIALSRDPAPPLRSLRGETPAELEAVIARCLAKQPEARYENGGELLAALRATSDAGASLRSPKAETLEGSAQTLPPPKRWHRVASVVAALAVLGVGSIGTYLELRRAPAVAPLDAATSGEPPRATTYGERMVGGGQANNGWAFDLSPSGARVAFDDGTGVWTQALPAGGRTPLPVPHAAAIGVVSIDFLDDDTIAYVVSPRGGRVAELWTLGLRDGAPHRLRSDPFEVEAATVARDGKHLAYVTGGGLHVGTVDGPSPRRIVTTGPREFVTSVAWSPASDALVYYTGSHSDRHTSLVWMTADGDQTRVIERADDLIGRYGDEGMAFAAPDRLLTLRFARSDSRLTEIPLGPHGARTGPSRTLFEWHGATIAQLRTGGGRIGFSKGSPNGEVRRYALAADGSRVDGAPRTLLESGWVLRPLGWLDDDRVAILEEQEDFFHVVAASGSGAVEPYVRGPLSTAWLAPNGDVLYWTKRDDGGACTLMRHVAADGSDRPAPMAGTTCDKPILCAASRCLADEEGEDVVSTFRAWTPESGATGAPLVRIDGADVRAALSSDGRWLATATPGEASVTLHDLAHDGARTVLTTKGPRSPQALAFTPDGRRLLYSGFGAEDGAPTFGVGAIALDGTQRATLVTDTTIWSTSPRVSRDGRSFAVGRKDFGAYLWVLEPR